MTNLSECTLDVNYTQRCCKTSSPASTCTQGQLVRKPARRKAIYFQKFQFFSCVKSAIWQTETDIGQVLHFIQKPTISFALKIKCLVSISNLKLGLSPKNLIFLQTQPQSSHEYDKLGQILKLCPCFLNLSRIKGMQNNSQYKARSFTNWQQKSLQQFPPQRIRRQYKNTSKRMTLLVLLLHCLFLLFSHALLPNWLVVIYIKILFQLTI